MPVIFVLTIVFMVWSGLFVVMRASSPGHQVRIEVRVVIAVCGATACVLVIRTMVVGAVIIRAIAIRTAVRAVIIRPMVVGAVIFRTMVIRTVVVGAMTMLMIVVIIRIVVVILFVVGVLLFRGRLITVEMVVGLALACAVDRGLDDDLVGRNVGVAGREVGCDLIVVVLQGLILCRRIVRRFDDCVFVVHPVAVQIDAEGHAEGIAGDRREIIAGRWGATARVVRVAGMAAVAAVVVMTAVVAMTASVAMMIVFVVMMQQIIKQAVTRVGKAAGDMAEIAGNMT